MTVIVSMEISVSSFCDSNDDYNSIDGNHSKMVLKNLYYFKNPNKRETWLKMVMLEVFFE